MVMPHIFQDLLRIALGVDLGGGTLEPFLVLLQIAFGTATLLTLAPILMQIGHLFLADAIWIVFVLMTAEFLAGKPTFFDASSGSESATR